MLSGHGVFRAGLYKAGLVSSGSCALCYEEDTVEHAVFHCPAMAQARATLERKIGEISPERLVDQMLESQESWNAVAQYCKAVVMSKEAWAE